MKIIKKKLCFFVSLSLILLAGLLVHLTTRMDNQVAYALSVDDVFAQYSFTRLNDTNCDVRITNKSTATRAIIPDKATIDGKEYKVTEIALNGFMSSTKLKRVTLPITLEKINNTAFANCTALEKVFLANVENIGNNVFVNCKSLSNIMIPKSVVTMGATVFRNCSTQVRVRAAAAGANWLTNWNANNTIEDVEYNSTYIEPTVLEPIYDVARTKSTTDANLVGYAIAGGQPYAEAYYDDSNIYIHATDSDSGKPILKVEEWAYSYNNFDKLIVEYSNTPISIESDAFFGCEGNSIIINRDIDYIDENNETGLSENIFTSSSVKTIVLPDTVPGLCKAMFYGCAELTDIHFIAPSNRQDIEEFVDALPTTGIVTLPTNNTSTTIGESAFSETTEISRLVIPSNVTNVESKIIDGWTNNQIVDIEYTYGKLPEYNGETETGWHPDFRGNGLAQILYSKYTINFDPDGGTVSVSNSKEVERDKAIGSLPTATKYGAVFDGWFIEKNGNGTQYTASTILSNYHDITLYAHWKYKLTFSSNGGSSVSTITGKLGQTVTLPTSIRNGYNGCWHDTSNNKYYSFGSSYTFSSNSVNFTASWSEKSFSELNNNGVYEIWTDNQFQYLVNYADEVYCFSLKKDFTFYGNWTAIPIFSGTLLGNNHTITYSHNAVPYGKDYGFIALNNGVIEDVTFKPTLNLLGKTSSDSKMYGVGGAVGVNRGRLYNVNVEATITSPYMNYSGEHSVDLFEVDSIWLSLGGVAGFNYQTIEKCTNYASIGCASNSGGIVGLNYENAEILSCNNYGNIYFNNTAVGHATIGGIAGTIRDKGKIKNCSNYATITWAARTDTSPNTIPYIARLAGQACESTVSENNYAGGNVVISSQVSPNLYTGQSSYVKNTDVAYVFPVPGTSSGDSSGGGCVAPGTLITLSNGKSVPVESLNGNEQLLVWNMYTGKFDSAPILFIDMDETKEFKVVYLLFEDKTELKIIDEHGLFDATLNKYVYLDDKADVYIGHFFNKQTVDGSGKLIWRNVKLIDVQVYYEYTTAWSPVTQEHLCYYVNGLLSVPGATEGLINIFDVNSATMQYDQSAMASDIEEYGLFTYDDFLDILPVSEYVFNAFKGKYLKVSIGKGYLSANKLIELFNRYSQYLSAE